MPRLHPYYVWDRSSYEYDGCDGTVVFAPDGRRARREGFDRLDWADEWCEMRARRLSSRGLWDELLDYNRTRWPSDFAGDAVALECWGDCGKTGCRIDWAQDMNGEYYPAGYWNLCPGCRDRRSDILHTVRRKPDDLRAYMVYGVWNRDEDAVPVFARTAREARSLASLDSGPEYIDIRAELLHDQWFWARYSPGEAASIEPPRELSCEACCCWSKPADGGVCGNCGAELPNPPHPYKRDPEWLHPLV